MTSRFETASDMISTSSLESARNSIRWLDEQWSEAETRGKKIRLTRFAIQASNRAFASTKRENISPKEKRESVEVGTMYRQWARDHRV